MELYERIALVRKAAGLSQEQLGELLGVTRQAVSKWESGQATPDALTIARLCESLHVSADYVLLGKEPEETRPAAPAEPIYALPDVCPCCGRKVSGTLCPTCGYNLPNYPPRGKRYALVAGITGFTDQSGHAGELEKYCGLPADHARDIIQRGTQQSVRSVLRRGLTDGAAQYIAAHLDQGWFGLRIVEDEGEENDDALLTKANAMEPPPAAKQDSGLGFWGVVGAVVVALLILSFL